MLGCQPLESAEGWGWGLGPVVYIDEADHLGLVGLVTGFSGEGSVPILGALEVNALPDCGHGLASHTGLVSEATGGGLGGWGFGRSRAGTRGGSAGNGQVT